MESVNILNLKKKYEIGRCLVLLKCRALIPDVTVYVLACKSSKISCLIFNLSMKSYTTKGGCAVMKREKVLSTQLLYAVRQSIEDVKRLLQSDPNAAKDIIAKMSELLKSYKKLINSNEALFWTYKEHLATVTDTFKRIQNLDMEPTTAGESVNDNIYFPILVRMILIKITDNVCIIEDDLRFM